MAITAVHIYSALVRSRLVASVCCLVPAILLSLAVPAQAEPSNLRSQELSAAARIEQLMDCAQSVDGGTGSRCLAMHELHTAPSAIIEGHWDAATMPQRVWLARWAQRTPENQAFLLERLPSEDNQVQYQILVEAMEGGKSREHVIEAALILIHQAADDSTRRPRNVTIDFSTDYREGWFGIDAYEVGEDYPTALQAAFDELVTYPYEDAAEAMWKLVVLDHPWLSTQAGIWLVRHQLTLRPLDALRYTLEADGLPPAKILDRIQPLSESDGISPPMRELFVHSIEYGGFGKWKAFATPQFIGVLSEPAVMVALLGRIERVPRQVAESDVNLALDETLLERERELRWLTSELDAYEWAARNMRGQPVLPDHMIRVFREAGEPFWQAMAMAVAMSFDRRDIAEDIARGFLDSPLPTLREEARRILAGNE